MSDFINSPPLPEYREEERCDYNTQGPVIRELTWQRDQLKLALDEMAFAYYYLLITCEDTGVKTGLAGGRNTLIAHGYLPRKEPK